MDISNINPSGFIRVYELLNKIADHLHPVPPKKVWVTKLLKKYQYKDALGPSTLIQELSDDELTDVLSIWLKAGLEPLYPSQHDWPKYKAAFESSPDRPEWVLDCHMECESAYPRMRNGRAFHKHKKSIEARTKDGLLVIRDDDLVSTSEIEWDSQMSISDARIYLEEIGLGGQIDLAPIECEEINRLINDKSRSVNDDSRGGASSGNWLTLAEAAKKLNCETSDLIRRASEGGLSLYFIPGALRLQFEYREMGQPQTSSKFATGNLLSDSLIPIPSEVITALRTRQEFIGKVPHPIRSLYGETTAAFEGIDNGWDELPVDAGNVRIMSVISIDIDREFHIRPDDVWVMKSEIEPSSTKRIGRPPKADKLENHLEELEKAAVKAADAIRQERPKGINITKDMVASRLLEAPDWARFEVGQDTLKNKLRASWWK